MKFTWILSVVVVFCYLVVFPNVSTHTFKSSREQFTYFFSYVKSSDFCYHYDIENLYMILKLLALTEETQFDRAHRGFHHKTCVVGWVMI